MAEAFDLVRVDEAVVTECLKETDESPIEPRIVRVVTGTADADFRIVIARHPFIAQGVDLAKKIGAMPTARFVLDRVEEVSVGEAEDVLDPQRIADIEHTLKQTEFAARILFAQETDAVERRGAGAEMKADVPGGDVRGIERGERGGGGSVEEPEGSGRCRGGCHCRILYQIPVRFFAADFGAARRLRGGFARRDSSSIARASSRRSCSLSGR